MAGFPLLRKILMAALLLLTYACIRPPTVQAQATEPMYPVLANVKQIGAGEDYTCVLTTAGGVRCWGSNVFGQLGDGGSDRHPFPMDVVGLSSGVKAISVGDTHACALTNAGEVRCWGDGVPGYLTGYAVRKPVTIPGLSSGVRAVDAGKNSTCVLLKTGAVTCWGEVTKEKYFPVDVPGLGDVAEIAVGFHDACARTTAGGVKCWGSGEENVPGLYPNLPVDIGGLTSGVLAIDVTGEAFCAVTADNVYCWGNVIYGGGPGWRFTPAVVTGLPPNVKAINVGVENLCAITQEDEVLCWGSNRSAGLGNDTIVPLHICLERCAPSAVIPPSSFPPTKVVGLNGPTQAIAAHHHHTCALSNAGTVQCWGLNILGVLGIPPTFDVPYPRAVQNLEEQVVSLELGGWHTCAELAGGSYRCWGYNWYGQLGTGDDVTHWSPRPLTVISDSIKSLAAGSYHNCAVTAAGAAQCWGDNYFGQLGNGTFEESLLTPVTATGLESGVKQVVAGIANSCALLENGSVQCWGTSGWFVTETDSPFPVPIPGLESGVASITAGYSHTCAVMTDGGVKCWQHEEVHDIKGLKAPVIKLDAGSGFNCALLVTGGVQCWGDNSSGQLGIDNKDITESPAAVDVFGLQSGVTDIAVGSGHACAVKAADAYCWGSNFGGRIGDGTVSYTDAWDSRYRPTKVVGLDGNVAAIFAGGTQTCAILMDHSVKCWGINEFGQLGFNPGWSPMDVGATQWLLLPFAAQ